MRPSRDDRSRIEQIRRRWSPPMEPFAVWHVTKDVAWLVEYVDRAFAAGFKAGRDAAAEVCEERSRVWQNHVAENITPEDDGCYAEEAGHCATAIRELQPPEDA